MMETQYYLDQEQTRRVGSRVWFLNDMRIWQKFALVWTGSIVAMLCFLSLMVGRDGVELSTADYTKIMLGLVAMIFSMLVALAQVRSVSRGLNRLIYYFEQIGRGHLDNEIEVPGRDEIGQMLTALREMQAKIAAGIDESKSKAESSLRIKTALNNVAANVLVVDSKQRITYANPSFMQMMFANPEVRRFLPQLDTSNLVGSDIGALFPDAIGMRRMLDSLSAQVCQQVRVANRDFTVVTSPVVSADGNRLGSVFEWNDVTQDLRVQAEVDGVVNAVLVGEFNRRIHLEDKQGFMRTLSDGINQLIDIVSNNLESVDAVMGALANGDLTQKVSNHYQGAFGRLAEKINQTIDKLREAVGQIQEASDVINGSSDEIAAGNADMSERTERQASALQQTSSTMEELTGTVRQNAENARQANQYAGLAKTSAEKGGQVVSRAIQAMAEISDSSSRIADIIGVINEIAFQTNLLALNASVEAARAGEQGRGFAVVATEVRNLAQRSATAAKEIKDLIVDSADKVKTGTQLVNQSGETLKELVEGIKRVGDMVLEIAAASQEQYSGIDQVNRAISQMDDVTQQHAALAEQTSAASETLNQQAQALVTFVSRFKLGDGGRRQAKGGDVRGKLPAMMRPKGAESLRSAKSTPAGHALADEWEEF
jgi:methyl-accepting chemotaxis protein